MTNTTNQLQLRVCHTLVEVLLYGFLSRVFQTTNRFYHTKTISPTINLSGIYIYKKTSIRNSKRSSFYLVCLSIATVFFTVLFSPIAAIHCVIGDTVKFLMGIKNILRWILIDLQAAIKQFVIILLGCSFLCIANSYAGVSSDPNLNKLNQEFLRQQEREEFLREQQEQIPDVMSLPSVQVDKEKLGFLPIDEKPCFKIKEILLVGEGAEKFQWALDAANETKNGKKDLTINRCLGARGINIVMRRVQNAIIKRGYVTTRILAQPQDLKKGTLKLIVVPGRINNVRFATKHQEYYGFPWNALPAWPGDLLNLRDIEQGLENFKRLPTVDTDIKIVPAQPTDTDLRPKPGESDLVIHRKQSFPLRLSLSVDDSGSKSTGKYIGNATISYDNPFYLNDMFYLNFNRDIGGKDSGSRGTKGYSIHYSIPFGYWLLGVTSSKNNYHQTIAEIDQAPVYSGESRNSEVQISRLIYRDAVRKTKLMLSGGLRSYKNFVDDNELTVQRRRMAGWEFGVNHREFIGQSVIDATLSYRHGTGALNSLSAPEEVRGEGVSRPQIILANVQFNLPFKVSKQVMRYTCLWKAQWNQTPLVPQDRFAIGSRYTVRGFDGDNLLSADRGWLIRNDLGFSIWKTGQEFYVGVDHGEVSGQSSRLLVGKRLTGGVVGLRGGYKWLSYDLFVGKPIKKPDGFKTSSKVLGFSVNLSF